MRVKGREGIHTAPAVKIGSQFTNNRIDRASGKADRASAFTDPGLSKMLTGDLVYLSSPSRVAEVEKLPNVLWGSSIDGSRSS